MCRSGLRGAYNRLRYGPLSPRPNQQLRVSPGALVDRYSPKSNGGQVIGSRRTGQVLDGDQHRTAFKGTPKYKACAARFRDGLSWDESGVITYSLNRIAKTGPFDGCATRNDILARYAALDRLWESVQDTGQMPPAPTHAKDSILVHIDQDGELLFGNQGFHRLAIAQIAGLETITVSLGVVHTDALRKGPVAYLK